PTMRRLSRDCASPLARKRRRTAMSDSTLAGKDFWMVLCTVSIDTVRTGRYARAAWRWARLLAPRRPEPGLRVFYGHDRIPGPGDLVAGGTAKFQRLGSLFPNRPTDFTLLSL